MSKEEKTQDKASSKSWLQRLKEESWEAEVLVSTVAIFGTFQLFGFVNWVINLFIDILPPSQYFIGYMIVFFGLVAVSILTSMFVLHFILRAYWVGLVGLNSVFPDYSLEDSAYSEIYTQKILAILPKLKDSIKKVDELCSVIFSAAFTFMLMYTYIALLSAVLLFLFNILKQYVSETILMIPVYCMVVFLIIQMLVTLIANLKYFKSNEKVQHWYFMSVKIGSLALMGPLYKSILQVSMIFGSNFKKKKSMVYLVMSCLVLGFVLTVIKISSTNIPYLIGQEAYTDAMWVRSYYEVSNKENEFLLTPEIASDIVKEKVIKIFIPIYNYEDAMSDKVCTEVTIDESLEKQVKRKELQKQKLNCYQTYHKIYVNDKEVEVPFFKHSHTRTNQFGILGYISLENPKKGMNTLKIKKIFNKEEDTKEWSIPFYYTKDN